MNEVSKTEALLGPASPEGLAFTRNFNRDALRSLAMLIGAEDNDLVLTHSTTEGVNIVLQGIDWKSGDELLTCSLEHPAISVPTKVLEERRGVRIVSVDLDPDASYDQIISGFASYISKKTRLIAISHIQFTSGLCMPVKEIAEIAHAYGAMLLVDGAQSVGHIQVDVKDLEVDFYALSGQKWLMGPTGTGSLYVSPVHAQTLLPLFRSNSGYGNEEAEKRSDLSKLSLVSQNPALVAGFAEALKITLETGMAVVEERIRFLADQLRTLLTTVPDAKLLGPTQISTASGLVTIGLGNWQPDRLVDALYGKFKITGRVVHNPDGVRFSTAYFNTQEELEFLVESLQELADTI
jgi:L-cysteine/cystine lyase